MAQQIDIDKYHLSYPEDDVRKILAFIKEIYNGKSDKFLSPDLYETLHFRYSVKQFFTDEMLSKKYVPPTMFRISSMKKL